MKKTLLSLMGVITVLTLSWGVTSNVDHQRTTDTAVVSGAEGDIGG